MFSVRTGTELRIFQKVVNWTDIILSSNWTELDIFPGVVNWENWTDNTVAVTCPQKLPGSPTRPYKRFLSEMTRPIWKNDTTRKKSWADFWPHTEVCVPNMQSPRGLRCPADPEILSRYGNRIQYHTFCVVRTFVQLSKHYPIKEFIRICIADTTL